MDMQIARTIWDQIGGNRFGVMTGAKNLAGGESYLTFKFGRNSSKSNRIRIKLEADDTYSMTFGHIRRFDYIVDKVFESVYNDGLRETFEFYTGMATSLGTMGA